MSGVRPTIRTGAIGTAVAVYLLVVGLVERFDERNVVTGVVTLGWLLLAATAAVAADRAAARRTGTAAQAAHGAVAGAVAGSGPALFLLLAAAVSLRGVLRSATPALVGLLSVAGSPAAGAARLVAGGALVGALAGASRSLPVRARRALLVALTAAALVSMLEPFLRVVLLGFGVDARWLYRRGGLTAGGAAALIVVVAGVDALWRTRREGVQERVAALPAAQRARWRLASLVLVVVGLALLPQLVGSFLSEVLGTVGLYVLLGIGLNLVVGTAGLLHLGYVAFFAVGAYGTAVLTSPASALGAEWSFWAALPVTLVLAAVVGVVVGAPVLRLRGDYLAIVTLAFGEIARILVTSDWARPLLGGAQGILQLPAPQLFGLRFRDPQSLYYLILVACLAAAFVSARLEGSRVGRAWTAMREDEQVAEVMGVNIARYKLLAFALGAAVGSVSGGLFAVKIGSVFPNSFSILVSITALAVVILGGIGSLRGVVVGAAVLVGLPELLREFAEYRLLLYGAALVALMVLRPEGLLPNARVQRELSQEEREQDQWLRRAGSGDGAPAITADAVPAEGA